MAKEKVNALIDQFKGFIARLEQTDDDDVIGLEIATNTLEDLNKMIRLEENKE